MDVEKAVVVEEEKLEVVVLEGDALREHGDELLIESARDTSVEVKI